MTRTAAQRVKSTQSQFCFYNGIFVAICSYIPWLQRLESLRRKVRLSHFLLRLFNCANAALASKLLARGNVDICDKNLSLSLKAFLLGNYTSTTGCICKHFWNRCFSCRLCSMFVTYSVNSSSATGSDTVCQL
jgi:hypothetical protein